jgi:hypothetical protein
MIELIPLLGIIFIAVIIILIALTLLMTTLIAVGVKTGRVPFPNVLILLISAFESPAKAILSFFGMESDSIGRLVVEIRNRLNERSFAKTKYSERLLLLPQCLRHSENCPAKMNSEGIQCVECGQCVVKQIKQKSKQLGYRLSIAPGGTFAVRMIKKHKPKAVLGVGCLFELREGLNACMRMRIPAQGVELLKTGCIDTIIDLQRLFDVMEMKLPEPKPVTAKK